MTTNTVIGMGEAARLLGTTPAKVRTMVARGELRAQRVGETACSAGIFVVDRAQVQAMAQAAAKDPWSFRGRSG